MTRTIQFATLMFIWLVSQPYGALAEQSDAAPQPSGALPPVRSDPDEAYDAVVAALDELVEMQAGASDADAMNQKLDAAKAGIAVVRDADPGDARLFYLNGRLYALMGRKGDAIRELRTYVRSRLGRNDWQGHRFLGDLLVNNYAALAMASYQKSLELHPAEPAVLYGLSASSYRLGKIREAAEWAEQTVVADNREDVRYMGHYAGLLAKMSRWDEALDEARAAVEITKRELKPTQESHRKVHHQLVLVEEILRARIAAGSGTTHTFLQLSDVLDELAARDRILSRFAQIAALKEGMETAPSTGLQIALAKHQLEIGQYEAARASMQALLEREPQNETARELLRRASGGDEQ